ncbi:hypothetical protein AQJ67_41905 [Streptomyces caeruleatus]|uniref:Uncharacterized protein n=1 Tax=Streptomyces caeruleatus TaxID=661399 RepID=A0A101TG19_9ACTN|nr:hypothetical protein AQJ67_41905 [Streptomyces caeruleatus]
MVDLVSGVVEDPVSAAKTGRARGGVDDACPLDVLRPVVAGQGVSRLHPFLHESGACVHLGADWHAPPLRYKAVGLDTAHGLRLLVAFVRSSGCDAVSDERDFVTVAQLALPYRAMPIGPRSSAPVDVRDAVERLHHVREMAHPVRIIPEYAWESLSRPR